MVRGSSVSFAVSGVAFIRGSVLVSLVSQVIGTRGETTVPVSPCPIQVTEEGETGACISQLESILVLRMARGFLS
jgi:hypothetical protein